MGNRKIAIVKELTKIHESVFRTTLKEANDFYAQNQPKGEFVLVVEGYVAPQQTKENLTDNEIIEFVKTLMDDGLDKKSAIKETALKLNLPKRLVYELMISNKED